MIKDRDYDDQRDEPTKKQPQDFDTPFSPPSDAKQRMPKDYPTTDSDVDQHELYDEGPDDASNDNPPEGERGAGPSARRVF